MVLEAMKGNKHCAEWLRDTSGEKEKGKKADSEPKTDGAVVFISGEEEILN